MSIGFYNLLVMSPSCCKGSSTRQQLISVKNLEDHSLVTLCTLQMKFKRSISTCTVTTSNKPTVFTTPKIPSLSAKSPTPYTLNLNKIHNCLHNYARNELETKLHSQSPLCSYNYIHSNHIHNHNFNTKPYHYLKHNHRKTFRTSITTMINMSLQVP